MVTARARARARSIAAGGLLAAALGPVGCIDYLDSGELGQFRYFGDVRGAAPLRFAAPISDREGNSYVLFGDHISEITAYVGQVGGGWSGGCTLHENAARGAHGWIGRAQERAWYWSGDALVGVDGRTGGCRDILDRDPFSLADIGFKSVIPWVKETPSRTTAVAMVRSPSDRVPFYILIDLDIGVYTDHHEFEPRGASNVVSLGVGANPDDDYGFQVVRYEIGEGDIRVQGRFIDHLANVTDVVNITGLDEYGEDSVVGFMQQNRSGWVVGVLETGEVFTFDRKGGRIRDAGNLQAVGVHRWEDEVYVVGIGNGRPAIARVGPSGDIEAPQLWESSERTARALASSQRIMDDRIRPVRFVTWANPGQAVGEFPFLHPHSPHQYSIGTSLLLLAGPSYTTAGESFTSSALGPAGLTYP
jgi:hypothetical protein